MLIGILILLIVGGIVLDALGAWISIAAKITWSLGRWLKMADADWVTGGAIGYFITVLFNAVLVVVKETYKYVYEWLASTFGHHWIGHGILVILVFILTTYLSSNLIKAGELSETRATHLLYLILAGTIISFVIIGGFFLIEFSI